jgi:hypothetical protein
MFIRFAALAHVPDPNYDGDSYEHSTCFPGVGALFGQLDRRFALIMPLNLPDASRAALLAPFAQLRA